MNACDRVDTVAVRAVRLGSLRCAMMKQRSGVVHADVRKRKCEQMVCYQCYSDAGRWMKMLRVNPQSRGRNLSRQWSPHADVAWMWSGQW